MTALLLTLALAGAAAEADSAAPLFTRPEPHLAEGAAALQRGDFDAAIAAFRAAEAGNDDERAIVEYDAASADLLRALQAGAAQQAPAAAPTNAQAAPAAAGPSASTPSAPKVDPALLDSAHAGYTRAYGLAQSRRQRAEAALALGNVEAQQNKLDDAIRSYRSALKDDVNNARARANLRRALLAKQEQQKQDEQKNDGGGEQKNDEQKNDEQKKSGDQKNDEQRKSGDQKKDDQKKDDQKKDEEPQSGQGGEKNEAGKEDAPASKDDTGKTAQQKRAEALRLREALRSREKPLSPLEMRGPMQQKRTKEKDW